MSCLLVLSNMVGRVMSVEAALEGVSGVSVPPVIGDCLRSAETEAAKPTDPG